MSAGLRGLVAAIRDEEAPPGRRAVAATVLAAPLHVLASAAAVGGLLSERRPGDVPYYAAYARRMLDGELPYRDFFMEYPPGALPTFLVPVAIGGDHYHLVFKLLMVAAGIVTLAAMASILAVLRAEARHFALALGAYALAPPLLGHVFLNRYDPYAAMLATLALALLLAGRARLSGAALGLGFVTKVYPAAAVPLTALRLWRSGGLRPLAGAAGWFALTVSLVSLPFVVIAFGGIGFSYYTQVTRDLQSESLMASVLLFADVLGLYEADLALRFSIDVAGPLADALGIVTSLLQVVAIVAVLVLYARGRDGNARLVTAFAATVACFLVFAKVLSPQYLVWLVPLVPLVPGARGRAATLILLATLPLTQLLLTGIDEGQIAGWAAVGLFARNVLLLAVAALLVVELASRTTGRTVAAAAAG